MHLTQRERKELTCFVQSSETNWFAKEILISDMPVIVPYFVNITVYKYFNINWQPCAVFLCKDLFFNSQHLRQLSFIWLSVWQFGRKFLDAQNTLVCTSSAGAIILNKNKRTKGIFSSLSWEHRPIWLVSRHLIKNAKWRFLYRPVILHNKNVNGLKPEIKVLTRHCY